MNINIQIYVTIVLFISSFTQLRAIESDSIFIQLQDLSGQENEYDYNHINDLATTFVDILPEDYQNEFKIFDFGFYVYNEIQLDRIPAIWDSEIQNSKTRSNYYLLFGREYSHTGKFNKIRVSLKLPENDDYSCVSRKTIKELENSISAQVNSNLDISSSEIVTKGLDYATKITNHLYNCCGQSRNALSCSAITLEEAVANLTNRYYQEESYILLENISNILIDTIGFNHPHGFTSFGNTTGKVSFDFINPSVDLVDRTINLPRFNFTNDILSLVQSNSNVKVNQNIIDFDKVLGDVEIQQLSAPQERDIDQGELDYYEDVLVLKQGNEIRVLFRLGDSVDLLDLQTSDSTSQKIVVLPFLAAEVAKRALLASQSIAINLLAETSINYCFDYLGAHIKHALDPECDSDINEFCDEVYYDSWATSFSNTTKNKSIWSYLIWAAEGAFADFLPNSPIKKAGIGLIASGLEYVVSPGPNGFSWKALFIQSTMGALVSVLIIYKGPTFYAKISDKFMYHCGHVTDAQKYFLEWTGGPLFLSIIKDIIGSTGNAAGKVKAWKFAFDFPNLRVNTEVLERLSTKYKNVLDDIDNVNSEFLESSIVHLDLGGHNRYPAAVKISYEDIDYSGVPIKNVIQVEPAFGNPQGGYISYLDNFDDVSTDLITVESATINDFLYSQVNRTMKPQGQFIIEVPTDLGNTEYLRIASEIGGEFDGVVDIVRDGFTLRRATFTKT